MTDTHRRRRWRPSARPAACAGLALLATVAAACNLNASPSPWPTGPVTATPIAGIAITLTQSAPPAAAATLTPVVEAPPQAGGPVLLRGDMTLRRLVSVSDESIKLALNPADGDLYILTQVAGLYRLTLNDQPVTRLVVAAGKFNGKAAGLAIGPDGTLYTVANKQVSESTTQATIRRGTPNADGTYTWDTLATTVPYPLSATYYDHLYNGIAVSPDGQYVFVNAGSRTDHGEADADGEAFPGLRDVALTARIFRLPAGAVDLELPNDEAALEALGVVYADGTRNAFDLEFAPNGELFAVDNGPDADYPDELNWIRPGRHYGFPWRFGDYDNPQQFPDYDWASDRHLQSGFLAVDTGLYRVDPTFPPAPGVLTDPLINIGPAAAQYRGDDGTQQDAADEGGQLLTFTPHRSPLGLVFATDAGVPADLRPVDGGLSAFILSFGASAGTLTDTGQDLLHLALTPTGDTYHIVARQIARDFKNPIDAVLIGNRLYVLEFGPGAALWEITFQ